MTQGKLFLVKFILLSRKMPLYMNRSLLIDKQPSLRISARLLIRCSFWRSKLFLCVCRFLHVRARHLSSKNSRLFKFPSIACLLIQGIYFPWFFNGFARSIACKLQGCWNHKIKHCQDDPLYVKANTDKKCQCFDPAKNVWKETPDRLMAGQVMFPRNHGIPFPRSSRKAASHQVRRA